MAAQLFANGNSQQQAGVLNGLMATLGPAMIAKFAGSAPNSPLAALLQSGSVTPAQAASVNPADVEALTTHAQTQDPSIIDRVSAIYAEHPVLIKSLGAAALTIAMKKIADPACRLSIEMFCRCKSPLFKKEKCMADLDQLKQKYSPVIETIQGFSDLARKRGHR